MQNKQRRKWQIISLIGIKKGEARNIEFKVDDLVRHCKGFIFTCNESGLIGGNYVMGDISLFVNNRKSHPLHYTVRSLPPDLIKRKIERLPLEECIEGGSFLQGYYRDLLVSANYPYNVKIYLDCLADNG
jgi:hypothetical protein